MAEHRCEPVYADNSRAWSVVYHFNTSILCNLEKILICRDNRTGMKKESNTGDENIKRIHPVSG